MNSPEILQLQIWILGGVISFLLVVLIAMLKANITDLKTMIKDHEKRIGGLEKHKERTEERHINNGEVIEEIKTKLDLIINRG